MDENDGGTIVSGLSDIARLVATMGMLGASVSSVVAQDTGDLSALRHEALDLTNAARAEAGLSELGPSELLDEVAQGHAADMLERDYYDHVSPEGETPFERFREAGGSRWGLSGENIATCEGCSTPPDAARVRAFQEGWMQSPGHRENILSDGFDSFGFGIVGEGDEIYAVQTFSGPGADTAGGGDAEPLTPEGARGLALDEINASREASGHDRLDRSDDLDSVAEHVLASLADDPDTLPEDVFGLLPDGSNGWTSLALQTASLGGTGPTLTREDVVAIISDWAAAPEERSLGGATASHFGFSAQSAGDGRTSAVAVFGGRE